MVLPLAIWTTGAPVPGAESARGDFFRMITEGVGEYPGGFLDVRSVAEPTYPDPADVSGIIVSGSPARLPDRESWMTSTMRALQIAVDAGVPILGICFGHQLLGEALGGKVTANPKGREIGTVDLMMRNSDPLFDGIDAEPHVVMTHLDSVVETPKSAVVLASTALDPHAALRFKENVWSVQYHPEMDIEILGYYVADRLEAIRAEGLDAEAILAARKSSLYGRQILLRFGRFCATGQF